MDNSTDEEDSDQLFEQYLRDRETSESTRSQTQLFDNELPMAHSYLGTNMTAVRGTNYYEPGKIYEIPLCDYHSLVFPGEIFPMIVIADSVFARNPKTNEGLTFGLVFTDAVQNRKIYGVTCQVFEKGVDSYGHITVKSKAHQRFQLVDIEGRCDTTRHHSYIAKVKILPELFLPDPITLTLSNHQRTLMQSSGQSQKLKSFLASSTRWPKFVYDLYSLEIVNEKIERYLSILNITAPEDPTQRSFWLARNVPLNLSDKIKIFTSNCVNQRMLLIAESLNFVSLNFFSVFFGTSPFFHPQMCFFECQRCSNQIASYSDIFAMAKGNVNANYCNPAGYIHETLTVHKTIDEEVLRIVDRPSSEFSWFPGYAWQIAVCGVCSAHIGWKFTALTKHLKPKSFFGLSCKSLVVSPQDRRRRASKDGSGDSSCDEN